MASSGEVGGWWLYVIALLAQKVPSCPFTNDSISAHEGSSVSSRIVLTCLVMLLLAAIACIARWAVPGGPAWWRSQQTQTIPGPCGWPVIGSLLCMRNLAHRRLAQLATEFGARRLMAFSLGDTRVVISSDPETARELLNSACFADRPLKLSAQLLLFHRAIGFAPYGAYWRNLRRIAATHLFSPKRIAAQEPYRQLETAYMLEAIETDSKKNGFVYVRRHLQLAALNNIMHSVFGQRYEPGSEEVETLRAMVREGYDLLGTFSWADHLSFLRSVDPQRIQQRCESLVPRVQKFVQKIIDEHRQRGQSHLPESDFVTVLLSLNDEEKLEDSDMVSVLWEMVFRGTDTTAILSEWIMAEVVLHPHVQRRIHAELDDVIGTARTVVEEDIPKLPYLQAVIKETLRMHPPGPLLSWARLAIQDTAIAGQSIPAGTTAMVNMWSITHDPSIWAEPNVFKPERFMPEDGGSDVDVRGNDLRLAPFGAGRRVCPGRALGQATVQLWVARLLHHFEWIELPFHPVSLQEVLKLSCEMKKPLVARPLRRISVPFSV